MINYRLIKCIRKRLKEILFTKFRRLQIRQILRSRLILHYMLILVGSFPLACPITETSFCSSSGFTLVTLADALVPVKLRIWSEKKYLYINTGCIEVDWNYVL